MTELARADGQLSCQVGDDGRHLGMKKETCTLKSLSTSRVPAVTELAVATELSYSRRIQIAGDVALWEERDER